MTRTLQHTATIDFEHGVSTECERDGCHEDDTLHAWIASGRFGRDGVAVLCPDCSQLIEERRHGYSYVGEVTAYGGQNDD